MATDRRRENRTVNANDLRIISFFTTIIASVTFAIGLQLSPDNKAEIRKKWRNLHPSEYVVNLLVLFLNYQTVQSVTWLIEVYFIAVSFCSQIAWHMTSRMQINHKLFNIFMILG